ncbi:hypothetical protein F5X99DRAFT_315327 [Biscogniauxia marginata]|nr:hypothetical protein F5X99DRAFT_315327 [Biscogniauxia marginata]
MGTLHLIIELEESFQEIVIMEWVQHGSLLRQEDMNVFKFWQMESRIFSGLKGHHETVTSLSKKLVSDEDWAQWLDEKQTERLESHQSGITLLIGGRAEPRIPGMEVSYLPFSKPVCERVVQVFQIHRSISRVINRNTTAAFSALTTNDPCTSRFELIYNCRSSSTWPNDLALSVTYSPYKKATQAVLYGCCERARAKFINRLSSCDFGAYHPLMLPTIFAEVERDRHFDILSPLLTELVNRVEVMGVADAEEVVSDQSSQSGSSTSEQPSPATQAPEHYMQLWLKISWLKNGLENWRQELEKMISHCDELRRSKFYIPDRSFESSVDVFDKEKSTLALFDELADLEDSGSRMQQRLLELKGEYDDKIRACTTIIDGMVLAAQLVSRDNYYANLVSKS